MFVLAVGHGAEATPAGEVVVAALRPPHECSLRHSRSHLVDQGHVLVTLTLVEAVAPEASVTAKISV
jgi:hypothetical protein